MKFKMMMMLMMIVMVIMIMMMIMTIIIVQYHYQGKSEVDVRLENFATTQMPSVKRGCASVTMGSQSIAPTSPAVSIIVINCMCSKKICKVCQLI